MAQSSRRFRPMGFGDILDEAFDLYKNNFVLLMGIGAVLYVPYFIFIILMFGSAMGGFMTSMRPNGQGYPVEQPDPAAFAGFAGAAVVGGLIMVLIQALETGAFTRAISERYVGEETTIKRSYSFVLSRLGAFLGTIILYGIVVVVPIFLAGMMSAILVPLAPLFVIAALILTAVLYFRLIFAPSAVIVEGKRYTEALNRSWELSAGNGWRIFGITVITLIIIWIISAILSSFIAPLFGLSKTTGIGVATVLGATLQSVIQALIMPVPIIITVLLYYDLRIRKEGFDLQMLARDLGLNISAEHAQSYASGATPQAAQAVQATCVHCNYPIRTAEDGVLCPQCRATMHRACWDERGGCATPGCPYNKSASAPQQ